MAGRTRAIAGIVEQMLASPRFTVDERLALRASSWLCDLGLIGVSREILAGYARNPDELSDDELAEIQSHPTYSQTLATHVDGRDLVSQIIRSHHERYDGDGYPDGLTGNAILWPARCLAAAVLMVESELPFDEALTLVERESGRALDPQAASLVRNYVTARADSHFRRLGSATHPDRPRRETAIYRSDGLSQSRPPMVRAKSNIATTPATFTRLEPAITPRLAT